MIAWLAYATLLSAVLAAGTAALEALLRARGWPVRWIWIAVIIGGLLGGIVAPLASAAMGTGVAQPSSAGGAAEAAGPLSIQLGTGEPSARDGAPAAGWLDRLLALLWVTGSGLLLGSLLLSGRRVSVLKRTGRRRRIGRALVLVDAPRGPAASGVLRPFIILPTWIRQLPPAQRRFMKAHEAEHLRACDPLLKLVGAAALVLVPWNVALWWTLRRLHLAIEVDCDARVVRRYRTPHEYAGFLLDVAGRPFARPALALGAANGWHFLERRVIAMMNRRSPTALQRLACTAVSATALALAFALERPTPPLLAQFAPGAAASSTAAADIGSTTAPAQQTGRITGAVTDGDGNPVAGAQVSVRDAQMAGITNSRGRFLLANVPAGVHTLVVTARNYRSQRVDSVTVVAGQAAAIAVTLTGSEPTNFPVRTPSAPPAPPPDPVPAPPAPPVPAVPPTTMASPAPAAPAPAPRPPAGGAILTGTVLDPDGRPVAGAQVRVVGSGIGAVSNEDGRFLLRLTEPGPLHLRITANGHRSQEIRDVGADATQSVTLGVVLHRDRS